VFRNNRNKQKTNRNSSNFVKISTFLIPHTISSGCFGCFDTGPKHRNKPKKIFFGFAKKRTKKQLKQIAFRFEPRKKIYCFNDPLIENVFWGFFRFVPRKFCLFRLFRYLSESPKQTETNRNKPKKMFFGFARNRMSFGLFQFEPKKKFDCFEDTPHI
jgi:hypothetical protein